MIEPEYRAREMTFEDALRERAVSLSDRQARLFLCACVRQAWAVLEEPSRLAIEVVERWVDGQATDRELNAAWARTWELRRLGVGSEADRAAMLVATPSPRSLPETTILQGCDLVLYALLAEAACRVVQGQIDLDQWASLDGRIRAAQEALFRDIAGPSPTLDSAWLRWDDALVLRLAAEIYDERRWADLPVLGDALEDAGCTDETILCHCHAPALHTRGCWLVDALIEGAVPHA
jgi:hypothetical protein